MMNCVENLEAYISPVPAVRREAETWCCRSILGLSTHEVEKMPPDHRSFMVSREMVESCTVPVAKNFIRPMKGLFRYLKAQKKE